jgi:hypothetical protein
MPYAFVGSGANSANGNTITYSPTAGNTIVVTVATSSGGGSPTFTVADNGSGSTWTVRKAAAQDGSGILFYGLATGVVGTGVTVITFTFNGGAPGTTQMNLVEYSGLSATGWQGISAFNKQTAPGTAANALTSNNFNVTTQPALLLGWVADEDADNGQTAGTSPIVFTRRVNGVVSMIEDARVLATGNAAATATAGASNGSDNFYSYVLAISEPSSIVTVPSQGPMPKQLYIMP